VSEINKKKIFKCFKVSLIENETISAPNCVLCYPAELEKFNKNLN